MVDHEGVKAHVARLRHELHHFREQVRMARGEDDRKASIARCDELRREIMHWEAGKFSRHAF